MNAILVPHLHRRGTAPVLPVFGVDVEILAGSQDTSGVVSAYLATCVPGAGAPPHRHPASDETFYILEGEFDVLCGETVQRLKAGDCAFAPRGIVHAFTGIGPGKSKLIGFGTPGGHEAFFKDCARAIAEGTFSPATGQEICQRHGIELVLPA